MSGGGRAEPEAEAGEAPSALDLEAAADDKKDHREERVAGPLVDLGDPLEVNLGDPGGHTTVRVGVALRSTRARPSPRRPRARPPRCWWSARSPVTSSSRRSAA